MLLNLGILVFVLLILIISISRWRLHPFIALILASLGLGLAMNMGGPNTVEAILEGFSKTLKWIAIVVILGAFIGEVLSDTGGAKRIAEAIVKRTGERKIPWAMGFTGYLVSIPVFVDVAYIILQPVTEALAGRSKRPVLVIGLALTAGLTISHTLIPPTPGPLAVAAILDADVGRLLWINGIVGLFAMTGGILWAVHYCKNYRLEYDDLLARRLQRTQDTNDIQDTETLVVFDLLPILIPIVLMALGAFIQTEEGTMTDQLVRTISTPMVAVLLGAVMACFQITGTAKRSKMNKLVEQAIIKSALVIMITGAGGAFGYVISESGMQDGLAGFFSDLPYLGLLLPFVIAAVLTTSTGSITVSLIGTASIVGPVIDSLPYSPELIAALTGCGAFCVFHANASFFWLLHKLHEVPVPVLYKTYTMQSLIMGLSGLLGVLFLWLLGVS